MPDEKNITHLEHYRRVCSQLDFFCKRMDDTFRLFIQLSTAVAGGFIWLKMQSAASTVAYLFPVIRLVIPLIGVCTIAQIWSDLTAWKGYRLKEADLNPNAPKPSFPWSGRFELLRIAIIAIVAMLAYVFLN